MTNAELFHYATTGLSLPTSLFLFYPNVVYYSLFLLIASWFELDFFIFIYLNYIRILTKFKLKNK